MMSRLENITAAQWCEDLGFLVDTVLATHPDPFTRISRSDFDRGVEDLRSRISDLPSYAVVVGLKRILASIHDGHSGLSVLVLEEFRRYPIRLYLYSDGLHVQAASQEIAEAVGIRVLSVGGKLPEEIYETLRSVANYDNEMGVKLMVPDLAVIPEVLSATGLADDMESVRFELQRPSGERFTLDISPVESVEGIKWVDVSDSAGAPDPLYLRSRNEAWWFEYLEEERTVYVQVNGIRDKEDETIAQFYDRLFAFVDANPVERLVLDIRHNGGGNNYLNQSLVHHLIRCDKVNSPGRLFTITGRKTFSAAMNLTNDLERHTRTLFFGEPTGSSPNHFGDGKSFTLPVSGIEFYVSTLRWQYSDPNDYRPWVAPDIQAVLSSADYAANRDPALDAILAVPPGSLPVAPFPERLIQAMNAFRNKG